MTRALRLYAGPRARAQLRERGLKPADVRVIPAAAGGPKGLVLNPLDRFLFGHWLAGSTQTLHLPGASSGAWRLACACRADADRALAEFAADYIAQTYPHEPGKAPAAAEVSRIFGERLQDRVGDHGAEILAHPQRRLHV
ncbi:MAG: phospholipase, partial [Burkholderiales bacterium]|nr:phospholipase [Burkholderiales bacterium]